MLKSKIKLYVILLCFSLKAHGKDQMSNTNNEEIVINSDNLVYDKNKNIAIFNGNVVLWFNDMVLKTTNIKIFNNQIDGKNKIDKIIIPNKLSALSNKNSDIIIADSAIYFFEKKELLLEGNVILQREGNIIKTNKLVFVTKLEKIANDQ